jgi:hypothetical protein
MKLQLLRLVSFSILPSLELPLNFLSDVLSPSYDSKDDHSDEAGDFPIPLPHAYSKYIAHNF